MRTPPLFTPLLNRSHLYDSTGETRNTYRGEREIYRPRIYIGARIPIRINGMTPTLEWGQSWGRLRGRVRPQGGVKKYGREADAITSVNILTLPLLSCAAPPHQSGDSTVQLHENIGVRYMMPLRSHRYSHREGLGPGRLAMGRKGYSPVVAGTYADGGGGTRRVPMGLGGWDPRSGQGWPFFAPHRSPPLRVLRLSVPRSGPGFHAGPVLAQHSFPLI
jgi:hypothetical protein